MPRTRKKKNRYLLNKLVDSVFHPLFNVDPSYIFYDFFAHCLVEGEINIEKFMKYNWRYLEKWMRDRKHWKH